MSRNRLSEIRRAFPTTPTIPHIYSPGFFLAVFPSIASSLLQFYDSELTSFDLVSTTRGGCSSISSGQTTNVQNIVYWRLPLTGNHPRDNHKLIGDIGAKAGITNRLG